MRLICLSMALACAAPQPSASISPAPMAGPPAASAAPGQIADMWRWSCCGGRYAGSLALTQSGSELRGIFLTDEGMATYVDGQIDGQRVVFRRRWLNAGRPFSQIYTSTLSADGQRLTGTFLETHAPGPASDFAAERRYQPAMQDFNPPPPIDSRQQQQQQQTPLDTADDRNPLLPPKCDCSRPCLCSGVPTLMRCHDACGCPACPPGIP